MSKGESIKKDANFAIKDVARLQKKILEFMDLQTIENGLKEKESPFFEDIQNFRSRFAELLKRIRSLLLEIRETPTKSRRPEEIFPLSTLALELKAQVEWLEHVLTQLDKMISRSATQSGAGVIQKLKTPVASALSVVKNSLLPFIQKFLQSLWSIISGLLTPTEWKLKGQVGTGLLGLANVEVEITFG